MSRTLTATAIGLVLAISASCAQQAPPTTTPANMSSEAPLPRASTTSAWSRRTAMHANSTAERRLGGRAGDARRRQRRYRHDRRRNSRSSDAAYAPKGVEFMMVNSNPKRHPRGDARRRGEERHQHARSCRTTCNSSAARSARRASAEAFVIDPKTWKIAYRGPLRGRSRSTRVVDGQGGRASPRSPLNGAAHQLPGPFARREGRVRQDLLRPDDRADARREVRRLPPAGRHRARSRWTATRRSRAFAPMIREAVRTDRMPPWDVDPHVGKFKDDKSLSADQIKTLVHWIEAGAPRGEGADPLAAGQARRAGMAAGQAGPDRRHSEVHHPGYGLCRLPVPDRRRTR